MHELNYFLYHVCSNISFIIFGTILYFLPLSRNYTTQLQIANEVLLSRGVRDDEFEFQEYLDSWRWIVSHQKANEFVIGLARFSVRYNEINKYIGISEEQSKNIYWTGYVAHPLLLLLGKKNKLNEINELLILTCCCCCCCCCCYYYCCYC